MRLLRLIFFLYNKMFSFLLGQATPGKLLSTFCDSKPMSLDGIDSLTPDVDPLVPWWFLSDSFVVPYGSLRCLRVFRVTYGSFGFLRAP